VIGRGAWWSAVALLTASVPVHGQDIAVQLRFDGRPLQTTAPPEFSCHDDNSGVWIGCKIAPRPATGGVALTFETMSRAYWSMKDADRAKAAIQEGLRRFPNGWQADQLRRTLERYEKG